MCLDISNSREKLIADKDITCYKVLVAKKYLFGLITKYRTPYYIAKVKLGRTYKSEISIIDECGSILIEKALHSFKFKSQAEKEASEHMPTWKIVECTIPKGSEYYIGEFDYYCSYASNKLKYGKIINKF